MTKRCVNITVEKPCQQGLKGPELLQQVIDPEIEQFEEWFSRVSKGRLVAHERDLLRSYLYHKLTQPV